MWEIIDDLPAGPLYLAGRYGRLQFCGELANLDDVWTDFDSAQMGQTVAQEEHDAALHPIANILVQYQNTLKSRFSPDHHLAVDLPQVYSSPGYSPKSVSAVGIWNSLKEMGQITWIPSNETQPYHYEIRYSPGTQYDPDVESTLAVLPASSPSTWMCLDGLREKGRTALFRVYVVLKSGNEAPSETIAITNGDDDE